jgi:molybdopterin molybdotransferase
MSSRDDPAPKDVRMHGFRQRAEVDAVLNWIDQHALRLGHTLVSLDSASGRVLAKQVIAPCSVPAFDRAAMDGYALRGAETSGASDYNPLAFAVLGQALPGQPFAGSVLAATAVRIMTGAAVPAGADAVVPAEYAQETGGQVEITLSVAPGKHIGCRGEDIQVGTPVLDEGRRLRPQDVGLLASLGVAHALVVQAPNVRVIVTGNEVVSPGEPKGLYQIYDANSAMLRGLISRDGGLFEAHYKLGDDPLSSYPGALAWAARITPHGSSLRWGNSLFMGLPCAPRALLAQVALAILWCSCFPAILSLVYAPTSSSPGAPSGY